MKKISLIFGVLFFVVSCEAIFVDNISNKAIVLLAPTNNATVTTGTVKFNWSAVEGADTYHIQIASPDFQNASQIVLDSITANTSVMKELEAGNYEWRVSASNSEFFTENITYTFIIN